MYQHSAHQVNISRKAVLCAPDSRNIFETPRILMICQVSCKIVRAVYVQMIQTSEFQMKSIQSPTKKGL